MEKTKELRVRLKKICSRTDAMPSPPPPPPWTLEDIANVQNKSSHAASAATTELPSTNTHATQVGSTSDSDSDDFTTIHFKAAALEAAAAHASGLLIDWQRMKSVLISGAKSVFKAKESTTFTIAETEPNDKQGEPIVEVAAAGAPATNAASVAVLAVSRLVNAESLSAESEFFQMLYGPVDSSFSSSSDNDEDDDVLFVPAEPSLGAPLLRQLTDATAVDVEAPGGCVIDDERPIAALARILERSNFNPLDISCTELPFVFKTIVSLSQLSLRENNEIEVEIKKSSIVEYSKSNKDRALSPFMDVSNIHVKHSSGEFFTFCSCKKCLEYREVVVQIMVEQFKAAHMVIMLLDVLIRAYGPMLKNETAYNKFDKLLDANKEVHWITCGLLYNKKMEHMDFIYDESLSENMILVLFSSILMVNNPVLLLQVLAFHMECIMKAYAEGFLEIVEPDNKKIPAEEMLFYILEGYDDLCRISDQISTYFFAFEKYFLNRFSMTWSLLCQRLYQQHVFMNLTDTMLACIITLKEEELTTRHAVIIRKYIQFDERMSFVDRCWTRAWTELNKFNLSEMERKRRISQLAVYRIFDTIVQDAIAFSLQEGDDDHDFYDFECLENRRLAWQNIMAYTKMKWPDGFFEPPNMLVCADKCNKCDVLLEYHAETCKCITCSIAGGPLPPKRNAESTCYKCLAHLHDKDRYFYESLILNVCASDDFLSFMKNNRRRKTTLVELGQDLSQSISSDESNTLMDDYADGDADGTYHVSWAIFKHLSNRRRYRQATVEQRYFCRDCKLPACLLARKILNDEVSPELAEHLVQYYQPVTMNGEELRAVLRNIMLYNRRMRVSLNAAATTQSIANVNDFVVKVYWTFIISVYATYFMDLDEKCPMNWSHLEVANNDIRLAVDLEPVCRQSRVRDDGEWSKDDVHFLEFLNRIKNLSPSTAKVEPDFIFSPEFQSKLDHFLDYYKKPTSTQAKEPELLPTTAAVETPPVEASAKKICKEKTKKCCFDHADLGDHCKENHASKKRIKKECNHARINETRDRLRKKLTQLVNARKGIKATVDTTAQQQKQQKTVTAEPPNPATVQQPPTLKSAATAAAAVAGANTKAKVNPDGAANCAGTGDDDSLECLSTLCKRFSHLQTSKTNPTAAAAGGGSGQANGGSGQANGKSTAAAVTTATATPPAMVGKKQPPSKTNSSANETPPASDNIHANASVSANNNNHTATLANANVNKLPPTASAEQAGGDVNSLDVVSEIYELIDNYSKDQSKVKKWINETLSFIEGPGSTGNGKKHQPQPTNPKKAAKKAKQKMRKEEEKRIGELQDLRWQFHDIYFKEFTDKQRLKAMKLNKKRDKKRIAELEANVKKLQRAKAKVETAILELIATVKQTSPDFKFAYLPTKEQQLKKLEELQTYPDGVPPAQPTPVAALHGASVLSANAMASIDGLTTTAAAAAASIGGLIGNYALPFAHAHQFPYHLDFQAQAAGAPLPAPMCYAPAQPPQQLSPDVVAAMAANVAACNSNTDPSKRIVTIRRINLPNVPEPQVTVTAKGASPDKDKLLYTFVNGQLVPTAAAASGSTLLPSANNKTARPMAVEPIFRLPLPPPQTKTQKKKERRLLAKLAAEKPTAGLTAAVADDEPQELRLVANSEPADKANGCAGKPKQKNIKKQAAPVAAGDNQLAEEKPQPSANREAHVPAQTNQRQKQQIVTVKKGAAAAGATPSSAASTPSYSAGTSASATPIGSQMNTRDSSVSSAKLSANKTKATAAKQAEAQQQRRQQQQATVPQQQQQTTVPQQQQQTTVAQQQQQQQAHPQKKTTKQPPKASAANPPIVQQSAAAAAVPKQAEPKGGITVKETKAKRLKRANRSKLLDQGQFDNNPFKSLHMQDSDLDWDSSTCDDDDDAGDAVAPMLEVQQYAVPAARSQTTAAISAPARKSATSKSGKLPPSKAAEPEPAPAATRLQPTRTVQPNDKKSKLKAKAEATTSAPILQAGGAKTGKASHQPTDRSATQAPAQLRPPASKMQQTVRTASVPQQQPAKYSKSATETANRKQTRNAAGGQKREERNASAMERRQGATVAQATNGTSQQRRQQHQQMDGGGGKGPTAKRAPRRQPKSHHGQQSYSNDDGGAGGIPNHMGYFNADDVAMPPPPAPHAAAFAQLKAPYSLAQHMQQLHIAQPHYAACAAASVASSPNNVSIMDQLNRGVQVENLALPPGITLTKVDPIKSEQLRQKSESIKKLSKPLQPPVAATPYHQHHQHPGATIIAPPVATVSSYYGLPYAGVAAAAGALEQSGGGSGSGGIIMVEANPTKRAQPSCNVSAAAAAASAAGASGKTSKGKKRRNKGKAAATDSGGGARLPKHSSREAAEGPTEMITLRNPMFHSGPAGAAATILQQQQQQQQPGFMPGRPPLAAGGGLALPPAPLPMDQPAAIIKNENGMFTIRNPALHQAVTNGLALGGYRQFGNVNYYTPQEAVVEAARATQAGGHGSDGGGGSLVARGANATPPSFSYFSNAGGDVVAPTATSTTPSGDNGTAGIVGSGRDAGATAAAAAGNNHNATHNTISISCTSVGGGGLTGEAAVIARPTPPAPARCISAIGSEIKSAQQQKQKQCQSMESQQHQSSQWTNFGRDALVGSMSLNGPENLARATGFGANPAAAVGLQEKYQQSSYYNGYDVFTTANDGGGAANESHLHHHNHLHHSCGDDSPPPSITGYNAYLEGIPNTTGVIRYDDATFLKNLIPGQNLNNEVSIHNVNDSNYVRNTNASPVAHRVEITPVYSNRPTSVNLYDQQRFMASYRDNMPNYSNDGTVFASNNLLSLDNLNGGGGNGGDAVTDVESFPQFKYDYEMASEAHKGGCDGGIIDFNEMLLKKGSHSQRTSPYLDEGTLENFVQSMNAIQIGSVAVDEQQCAHALNGGSSNSSSAAGNANGCSGSNSSGIGGTHSTSSNGGWW